VFGHVETAMGGFMIHTIGLARAKVKITFKNIAYNFQRWAVLKTLIFRSKKAKECLLSDLAIKTSIFVT
jgi:hypothetical protein